uniref:Uncharacterized protein n=1 Tax=Ralstonia solanacearum TaxID=305 RepID=A0A0S4TMH7_RALSL|nr:protein of unknown function [Ralstonia solanacearum]
MARADHVVDRHAHRVEQDDLVVVLAPGAFADHDLAQLGMQALAAEAPFEHQLVDDLLFAVRLIPVVDDHLVGLLVDLLVHVHDRHVADEGPAPQPVVFEIGRIGDGAGDDHIGRAHGLLRAVGGFARHLRETRRERIAERAHRLPGHIEEMDAADAGELLDQRLHLHPRDRAAADAGDVGEALARQVPRRDRADRGRAHAADQAAFHDGDGIVGVGVVEHDHGARAFELEARRIVLAAADPLQPRDRLLAADIARHRDDAVGDVVGAGPAQVRLERLHEVVLRMQGEPFGDRVDVRLRAVAAEGDQVLAAKVKQTGGIGWMGHVQSTSSRDGTWRDGEAAEATEAAPPARDAAMRASHSSS